LLTGVIAGVPYAAYMFCVDVRMYWSRWVADEASGRMYLTLAEGVRDAFERRVVAHDWAAWQCEVMWMSLYFSVAVWISISLVHAAMRQLQVLRPQRCSVARFPFPDGGAVGYAERPCQIEHQLGCANLCPQRFERQIERPLLAIAARSLSAQCVTG
jgi:hypothetical protein